MQFSPLLTFLISFLCNSYSIPSASSLNDEGSALLSFKRSITQDPSFSLSNWNSSDSTPCSWNGITCSKQQKVVSLSIPNKKLSGPLSPSLASLPEIRHINLRSNRLHGPLPPALFRAARGLQSLVLYGNHLSGPLPPDLGNLEFLQTLDLSRNLLSGSLPASLLRCKRLRTLDFSRNNLTGPIPPEIGAALGGTLRTLDLSRNLLSGPIPGSLGELSELQGTLDLSRNAFAGPVPADLGRLPEKVYIDLTYNNLSGPIPQNGALVNRGPTAFIGNVGLCGPPLKKPCSFLAPPPPGLPDFPTNSSTRPGKSSGRRGMSKGSVALIVICDLVGICVIGLLCSFCYLRIRGGRVGKEKKGREFPCFKKEMLSEEESEEDDLVGLDGRKLSFDLDELLKASAFVLGKSGIGILYKVVLEDGQCLAVRRLGEGGAQRFKEFQTEVEAIGKLRHPNIVNLRGYYWSVDEKLLIYDLVQNGNLATAIHGKPGMAKFDPMPWSVRLKIMKGLARGLIYIHEHSPKKYVHGNLKPSNILLSSDAGPMISDFGLSRLSLITGAGSGGSPPAQSNRTTTTTTITAFENQLLESSVPTSASLRSSSHYQAPESLRAVKPSQKWDVYSYGVILLEMITGREVDLVRWMEVCLEERRSMLEVVDPHLVREEEREDEEIITVLKIAMACAQAGPERRPAMRHVVDSIERVGPSYD